MDLLSKAVDMLKTTTLTENGHEAYHDYYFSSFLDQCVIFNTKAIGNRPGSKNSSGGISRTDFESHLDKLYTMLGNCNDEEYDKNICYLITLLFYFRDIQEGKGERDLFYWGYLWMYKKFPELMLHMLDLLVYDETTLEVTVGVPYGSWKDLNKLMEYSINDEHTTENSDIYTQLHDRIVKMYSFQLLFDKKTNMPSLAAKWAPRENKYVDNQTNLVELISNEMFGDIDTPSHRIKLYRKTISNLNKKINTVELLQCSNNWAGISPKNVPSKALKQYMKAFLYTNKSGSLRGNLEDRLACREKFLEEQHNAFVNPNTCAFNTKDLQPHEIISVLLQPYPSEDDINNMTALWNKYISNLKKDFFNEDGTPKMPKTLAMCDVSGSMDGLPMNAAIAITLLLIELLELNGNCALTFESEPHWVNFSKCTDLYSKVTTLKSAPWGGSTNISKAFNLILSAAVAAKLPQSAMFERLVILTDMQFDAADRADYYNRNTPSFTSFSSGYDKIKESFNTAGYKMPEIIFWNFRGNTNNHITEPSQTGVTMLSGFSGASILKDFFLDNITLSSSSIDKLKVNILDKPRYKAIYDTYNIINT
tara:strand:+ start:9102 stop:10877 length:1776 start_codon:yes stop_codon:yes gene_type:complete